MGERLASIWKGEGKGLGKGKRQTREVECVMRDAIMRNDVIANCP